MITTTAGMDLREVSTRLRNNHDHRTGRARTPPTHHQRVARRHITSESRGSSACRRANGGGTPDQGARQGFWRRMAGRGMRYRPSAAWYCSTTLAGMRPRPLTAMPWSLPRPGYHLSAADRPRSARPGGAPPSPPGGRAQG
jgi:hypothetical protein